MIRFRVTHFLFYLSNFLHSLLSLSLLLLTFTFFSYCPFKVRHLK
ncbi:unnamed protein product [Brugia timori]|uniref:Uncharacterized protein n=1 Tax=Brugia timori TaxID=42155 RepID=A0A0R3QZR1_9BILA|nr:unnamed protein product [Brugia timori]